MDEYDMDEYKARFYRSQHSWHSEPDKEDVISQFEIQQKYHEWFVGNWIPNRKDTSIIDLGCGNGNLLYYLKNKG